MTDPEASGYDPDTDALVDLVVENREQALRRLQRDPDREFMRRIFPGLVEYLAADRPVRLTRELFLAGIPARPGADLTRHTLSAFADSETSNLAYEAVLACLSGRGRVSRELECPEPRLRLPWLPEKTQNQLVEMAERCPIGPHKPRLLSVVGPPGSGKSEVVQWLLEEWARRGWMNRWRVTSVPATSAFSYYSDLKTFAAAASDGVLYIHHLERQTYFDPATLDTLLDLLRADQDCVVVLGASEVADIVDFHREHAELQSESCPPLVLPEPTPEALTRYLRTWRLTTRPSPAWDRQASEVLRGLSRLPAFAGVRTVRRLADIASADGHRIDGKSLHHAAAVMAPAPESEPLQAVLGELEQLVGLESAKRALREVTALAVDNDRRRRSGLPAVDTTYHMALLGEPGTGKTTVARLMGRLLHASGALATPHVEEVTRDDLVGEFIGQTAPRTKAAFSQARGGVLFVDEAYALDGHDDRDFGQEALSMLVQLMETHREDTAVVLAGYPDPMQRMIDLNPGLRSRLAHVLTFEPLATTDLLDVFVHLASRAQIHMARETRVAAASALAATKSDPSAGNARGARTLFERAAARRALRLLEDPDADPRLLAFDVPRPEAPPDAPAAGQYL